MTRFNRNALYKLLAAYRQKIYTISHFTPFKLPDWFHQVKKRRIHRTCWISGEMCVGPGRRVMQVSLGPSRPQDLVHFPEKLYTRTSFQQGRTSHRGSLRFHPPTTSFHYRNLANEICRNQKRTGSAATCSSEKSFRNL